MQLCCNLPYSTPLIIAYGTKSISFIHFRISLFDIEVIRILSHPTPECSLPKASATPMATEASVGDHMDRARRVESTLPEIYRVFPQGGLMFSARRAALRLATEERLCFAREGDIRSILHP
jgi:hypothetical protein